MGTRSDDEHWVAQLRKGSLELCVLALLVCDERYGYELAQALATSGGLEIGEGTLYPLLSRLQREGLVSASWRESPAGPPRKYYALTAEGRRALRSMRAEWEAFSGAVEQILQEARDGK